MTKTVAQSYQAMTKADWEATAKQFAFGPRDRIKLLGTPATMGAARYAAYRDGMTLTSYLASGGTRQDLEYDRKRGHVTLHDADVYRKLVTLSLNLAARRPKVANSR